MSLTEAIADAREAYVKPPPNEGTTCHWIIDPLLEACGYARREIYSRVGDGNGQFPDYTLLPADTPHTWYLEAKAWSLSLQDSHAQQAMRYAYDNGRRWVVLSNGRTWRLYDSTIQGVASDRFVVASDLNESTFVEFLTAIGRQSVITNGLEAFANEARIRGRFLAMKASVARILADELIDASSP